MAGWSAGLYLSQVESWNEVKIKQTNKKTEQEKNNNKHVVYSEVSCRLARCDHLFGDVSLPVHFLFLFTFPNSSPLKLFDVVVRVRNHPSFKFL